MFSYVLVILIPADYSDALFQSRSMPFHSILFYSFPFYSLLFHTIPQQYITTALFALVLYTSLIVFNYGN